VVVARIDDSSALVLGPELGALGWAVPAGRPLDLPGRGTTFVRELPGPPGGPTLVLLHGLAANAALNWFTTMAPLGAGFRVIAMDHRGHGRGIRARRRFRLADCADDVVAMADALGIERFIPVGYSMGGPIAQLTWHRHRERVAGMVLCATSRNFRGRPREQLQFAAIAAVATIVRGSPAGPIRDAVEGLLVPSFGEPRLRQWVRAQLHQNDVRSVIQAADTLGRFSSHSWIGRVDVPTSVVVTQRDRLVPAGRQLKLARSIPGAVVHVCDGDHLVCATNPERFLAALIPACDLVASRAS